MDDERYLKLLALLEEATRVMSVMADPSICHDHNLDQCRKLLQKVKTEAAIASGKEGACECATSTRDGCPVHQTGIWRY